MEYTKIQGDLFKVDKDYALVHCISRDAKMGKGIAKTLVETFPDLKKDVLNQEPHIGDAIMHITNERVIFNLVTKPRYFHKPTYTTLTQSLMSLKDELKDHHIKRIAMPKIGSGLDRLDWELVEKIIKDVFSDTDIEILVVEWK